MRDVLIDIFIGLAIAATLALPWWLPVYHRWIDSRMVRRINARRAQFRTVRFPDEHCDGRN